jgi:hypothetical protein
MSYTFEQQRAALLDLGMTVLGNRLSWHIEGELQPACVGDNACSGCA